MFNKRITRKEFLKSGFIGMLAILAMPIYRMLNSRRDIPYKHKEARYYKNLAG